MFYRYRVHELDGSDAGEAHSGSWSRRANDLDWRRRKLRVVDVVPVEGVDGSPFVGLLRVSRCL
jgi:hypothetical protein